MCLLKEFDRGHDYGGDSQIGAYDPLDDVDLAESYQLLSLLAQRLYAGVGCRDLAAGFPGRNVSTLALVAAI